MEIFDKVINSVANINPNRVLIHSDIMKGFPVKFTNRYSFTTQHIELLTKLYNSIPIWMPTFNYNFCRGEVYSIKESPSQLGVLSEFFRKNVADWRTITPVFSIAGSGVKPGLTIQDEIDPFNENSAFHLLNNDKSLIMHYGSELKHTTLIHYVERISQRLSYRYDKVFVGTIKDENEKEYNVKLKYHVRPMGYHLDYNWEKLYYDLKANKILLDFNEGNTSILLIKANELIQFWCEEIEEDHFYLLDNKSKNWILPKLDKLGRSFLQSDFE